MGGGGSVSGSEHRGRSSRHQAPEERRGAEGNLHQTGFTKQSRRQDSVSEDRGQDPGGGARSNSCSVAVLEGGVRSLSVSHDVFLQVSGVDLRAASHEEAVSAIKSAPSPVVFIVQSLSATPRVQTHTQNKTTFTQEGTGQRLNQRLLPLTSVSELSEHP